MKYLKDIHEHLTNRSEVSKKLKKFFGVFAVALLLMSVAPSNTTLEEVKNDIYKEKDLCKELASIQANNWCCEWFGEDYGSTQYFLVYSVLSNSMGC